MEGDPGKKVMWERETKFIDEDNADVCLTMGWIDEGQKSEHAFLLSECQSGWREWEKT